jgi:glutathione synthase/RimK-type ligase-like ATP-grasp enzyme
MNRIGISVPLRIGVFSWANDMHARVICEELGREPGVQCEFVAVDEIHGSGGLCWGNTSPDLNFTLPVLGGKHSVDVRSLDLIWWRRAPNRQRMSVQILEKAHSELIDNDSATAIAGIAEVGFKGIWVSDPNRTRRSENKILQLHAAKAAGLRVPETLVTQDPEAVAAFLSSARGGVVVKTLRGTSQMGIPTSEFTADHLQFADSIRASPAIYQERIEGHTHLRIHCFGQRVITAAIESPNLDWRGDLTVPFRSYRLPESVKRQLSEVLSVLGLKMGVIDMKLTPEGEFVWLEVNPQGQFLFVEALVPELNILIEFLAFLREEARGSREFRCGGSAPRASRRTVT